MYFNSFPKLKYSSTGSDTDAKIVTHLLRRVAIKQSLDDDMKLMDDYFVKEGETPENLSHKHFGSAKYHWVILLTNNITDRYFGWPLGQLDFEKMIKDKYGATGDGIHHYEITQTSGPETSTDYSHLVQCNSTETGALPVSNREYEQRVQDEKRRIKLLAPNLLTPFVQEFKRIVNEPSVA